MQSLSVSSNGNWLPENGPAECRLCSSSSKHGGEEELRAGAAEESGPVRVSAGFDAVSVRNTIRVITKHFYTRKKFVLGKVTLEVMHEYNIAVRPKNVTNYVTFYGK